MTRKAERGEATRTHILEQAAALFAAQGYEAVSIEAVLAACGISRGALYHHFAGKQALFTAVLEREEERVAAVLAAAAIGQTNPLDMLRAGCAAWLDLAASDPAVRRIVLIDAPAVVGWETWREIDSRHGLGLLKAALLAAAESGRLPGTRVNLYAHTLLAVLTETALLIARAADAAAMVRDGNDAVELVLSRFMGLPPHAAWSEAAPLAS